VPTPLCRIRFEPMKALAFFGSLQAVAMGSMVPFDGPWIPTGFGDVKTRNSVRSLRFAVQVRRPWFSLRLTLSAASPRCLAIWTLPGKIFCRFLTRCSQAKSVSRALPY
jgi:hypothetical protein